MVVLKIVFTDARGSGSVEVLGLSHHLDAFNRLSISEGALRIGMLYNGTTGGSITCRFIGKYIGKKSLSFVKR